MAQFQKHRYLIHDDFVHQLFRFAHMEDGSWEIVIYDERSEACTQEILQSVKLTELAPGLYWTAVSLFDGAVKFSGVSAFTIRKIQTPFELWQKKTKGAHADWEDAEGRLIDPEYRPENDEITAYLLELTDTGDNHSGLLREVLYKWTLSDSFYVWPVEEWPGVQQDDKPTLHVYTLRLQGTPGPWGVQ